MGERDKSLGKQQDDQRAAPDVAAPGPVQSVDPTGVSARAQSDAVQGRPPGPPGDAAGAQAEAWQAALSDPQGGCQAGHHAAPHAGTGPVSVDDVRRALAEGRWTTDSLAARLSDAELATFATGERLALIDHIADGLRVGDEDERTLIRLVATAPDPAAVLAGLRADGSRLLRLLDDVIHGDEYTAYRETLRRAWFAARSPREAADAMAAPVAWLPWADPGLVGGLLGEDRVHYETVEYNDAGLIDIEGWVMAGWVPFGVSFEMRGLDPMALVAVKFFADEAAVATQEGQVRYMPAAEFVGLYHKQQGQMRADLLDVALLAAGGLGAVGAASRAMRVIGLVEAAIGGADMVVRSQRAAIEASPEGRAFLAVWEKVVLLAAVYGAAQVAAQLPKLVRAARQAWGRVAGKVDPAAARRVEAELARVEGELGAVDHLADVGHIKKSGGAPDPHETATTAKLSGRQVDDLKSTDGAIPHRDDELHRQREKLTRTLHQRELGLDPDIGGRFRPQEALVASDVERLTGRRLTRSSTVGDWVDEAGRTYDAVGPVPVQHFDFASFAGSISSHLLKSGLDFVVIDLRGLPDFDVRQVDGFIARLGNADRLRLIIFR